MDVIALLALAGEAAVRELRVVTGGALGLGLTYGVGKLFGTAIH